MLADKLFYTLLRIGRISARRAVSRRNIGLLGPCLQKTVMGPIQQLIKDKVCEYNEKSDNGKKLVNPNEEIQVQLKRELEKIAKKYDVKSPEEMTKFPVFEFNDIELDPPFLQKEDMLLPPSTEEKHK